MRKFRFVMWMTIAAAFGLGVAMAMRLHECAVCDHVYGVTPMGVIETQGEPVHMFEIASPED